jgi:hypothetical protein
MAKFIENAHQNCFNYVAKVLATSILTVESMRALMRLVSQVLDGRHD